MYFKVVVKTGQKKDILKQISPDHFEVSVREKPERNMANKKVLELIASNFAVPTGKVRIINGHHHPHKLLVVDK